jgi:predicted SnoaL-like aldol condensation-catalyzing enzyme
MGRVGPVPQRKIRAATGGDRLTGFFGLASLRAQQCRVTQRGHREDRMFGRILAIAAVVTLALVAPQAQASDTAKMERNKKNVVEFYNAVLNEKNFDKAKTYVGATYIQHNPIGADGLDGIKGFINFLKDKFPNNKSEIKRVFADGDYVIVHVHAVREPGTRGNAIFDLFRLDDNGKVLEHWDAVQPIPEPEKALNKNGMF